MEKYAVWFELLLKKNFKRKTVYIQSVVLIVLLFFIQSIHIPDSENTKIGICFNDSRVAEEIYDNLIEQSQTYEFREYKSKETLEKAVMAGKVEGGFYFIDDFDDDFFDNKIKDVVEFFATPMSAKAELIQENFYIAFLKEYSEVVLRESEMELYDETKEERIQEILSLNQEYLKGDEIFKLNINYVDTDEKNITEENSTFRLQGIYGMFVFLFMFLSYNKKNRNKASDFRAVLNKKDGLIYDIEELVLVGVIPALSGLFFIIFTKESRGVLIEIVATIILLILSTTWILIFAAICKNEINYLSTFLIISIAQVILCPVFWDISIYSKFLVYIRYLFPLGTYLLL